MSKPTVASILRPDLDGINTVEGQHLDSGGVGLATSTIDTLDLNGDLQVNKTKKT